MKYAQFFKKAIAFTALAFLSAFFAASSAEAGGVDNMCRFKGIPLHRKVKKVSSNADIKVKVTNSFPDLKVQQVNHFPDKCGQWQWVEHFPDFTVQFVDSFPDITIKYVNSFPGKP